MVEGALWALREQASVADERREWHGRGVPPVRRAS